MKVLLIDNYDSFTYNLYQMLRVLGADVIVRRNDELSLDQVDRLSPTHLVISPGPGRPEQAGLSCAVIEGFYNKIPILGVCLGHQCVAHVFGGRVRRAPRMMHGKTSAIHHDGRSIFRGVTNPFRATRYHSLIVERDELPDLLEVSASTAEGEIMGLRLKAFPVEGVQFHPESIMTPEGAKLISNFLQLGAQS
ncbi:MAG: aminodeoxychorismate/anthranilate synthase component II [Acidobacteriota bacterium]|nr:aminodeoxychorismate/anthranilate synthase component II [Blastocatellia bacterium]MDW8240594.1 aminodeoxychorismate/anthranilate synthase component II [Acidobacteriota bacterium]